MPSRRRSLPEALLAWLAPMLLLVAAAACGRAEAPLPDTGPALWRLSDSDSEIWLFGTVHVLAKDQPWRTKKMAAAFAKAETIYFETPTDAAAAAKIGALFAREGAAPADAPPLSQTLSPEARARYPRVLDKLAIPADARAALERTRPWLVALQLSLQALAQQGQTAEHGVEPALEADARRLGKRTAYFETAEEQIATLATLPPAAQNRFLESTLRQIEEDMGDPDQMDALWLKGDAVALSKVLEEELAEAGPEVAAALLYDRNARWVSEIERMLQGKGAIFIAVGAGHLAGGRSVPDLLRQKGYVVEGP